MQWFKPNDSFKLMDAPIEAAWSVAIMYFEAKAGVPFVSL